MTRIRFGASGTGRSSQVEVAVAVQQQHRPAVAPARPRPGPRAYRGGPRPCRARSGRGSRGPPARRTTTAPMPPALGVGEGLGDPGEVGARCGPGTRPRRPAALGRRRPAAGCCPTPGHGRWRRHARRAPSARSPRRADAPRAVRLPDQRHRRACRGSRASGKNRFPQSRASRSSGSKRAGAVLPAIRPLVVAGRVDQRPLHPPEPGGGAVQHHGIGAALHRRLGVAEEDREGRPGGVDLADQRLHPARAPRGSRSGSRSSQ